MEKNLANNVNNDNSNLISFVLYDFLETAQNTLYDMKEYFINNGPTIGGSIGYAAFTYQLVLSNKPWHTAACYLFTYFTHLSTSILVENDRVSSSTKAIVDNMSNAFSLSTDSALKYQLSAQPAFIQKAVPIVANYFAIGYMDHVIEYTMANNSSLTTDENKIFGFAGKQVLAQPTKFYLLPGMIDSRADVVTTSLAGGIGYIVKSLSTTSQWSNFVGSHNSTLSYFAPLPSPVKEMSAKTTALLTKQLELSGYTAKEKAVFIKTISKLVKSVVRENKDPVTLSTKLPDMLSQALQNDGMSCEHAEIIKENMAKIISVIAFKDPNSSDYIIEGVVVLFNEFLMGATFCVLYSLTKNHLLVTSLVRGMETFTQQNIPWLEDNEHYLLSLPHVGLEDLESITCLYSNTTTLNNENTGLHYDTI